MKMIVCKLARGLGLGGDHGGWHWPPGGPAYKGGERGRPGLGVSFPTGREKTISNPPTFSTPSLGFSALLFVILMALFSSTRAAAEDFNYVIENDQVTITAYVGPGGHVEIPSLLGGKPVTGIGSFAFGGWSVGRSDITSIAIPASVTSIGDWAFSWCTGLTSITIPDSVISIGDFVFHGCTGLTSIHVNPDNPSFSSVDGVLMSKDKKLLILFPPGRAGGYNVPASVTSIGDSAFYGCTRLTSVTVGNSVTSIGDSAFSWCTGLTSVTIGNSVTSIGGWAFSDCTGLTSITIPDSVTSIGNGAFSGCTGLVSVTTGNSVTRIGDYAFSGCTGLASITIPNSVISIGGWAFSGCTGLASIIIGDSVTRIGDSAFYGCTGLASVTIGNSVTSIGATAFWGCTGLTSIHVNQDNPSYSSGDGVLMSKDRKLLILFPPGRAGGYNVPASVTSIGDSAFYGCTGLTSIIIPKSVTTIGSAAFAGCTRLRRVYFLGDRPSQVGYSPFSETSSTIYRLSTATGWGSSFEGRPVVSLIPEEDNDLDGMSNLRELVAGTDPLDPNSVLAFERAARPERLSEEDRTAVPPGQFALYFQSVPGRKYQIEFAEGLEGPWIPAGPARVALTNQQRAMVDRPATTGFYRIGLVK